MPPENSLPDSTFVEDTAFVFEDRAFLCFLKEETRRNEMKSIEKTLKSYCKTVRLPPYLDGGDILDTPDSIFIGLSGRTDVKAIESLSQQINKKVVAVPILKGLHLKSAVSYLGSNTLLLNPERVDSSAFKDFKWIEVEEKILMLRTVLLLKTWSLCPLDSQRFAKKFVNKVLKPLNWK